MRTEQRNGENHEYFRLYLDLNKNKNICSDSTILMYAFSTNFVNANVKRFNVAKFRTVLILGLSVKNILDIRTNSFFFFFQQTQ